MKDFSIMSLFSGALKNMNIDIKLSFKSDKYYAVVIVEPKVNDDSKENLVPFIASADSFEELQEEIVKGLEKPMSLLIENVEEMNAFVLSVERMKEKSAMEEAKKKEKKQAEENIKIDLEKAEKHLKEDEIDKAEKLVKNIFSKEPKHKATLELKKEIDKKKGASAGLFDEDMFMPAKPMSEEQIEMIKEEQSNNNITI